MDMSSLTRSLANLESENVEELEQLPEWLTNFAKYSWTGEEGYVSPELPDFEKRFFTTPYNQSAGEWFDTYCNFTVTCEGKDASPKPMLTFNEAGLHPVLVRNTELIGYKRPTPIQAYCIPAILGGYDVVGISQTGSGKTAAYMIPILSKLTGKAKKLAAPKPTMLDYDESKHAVRAEPLVLVVCPTRELAIQIFDHARRLCYRTFLRPCMAYGGGPRKDQLSDLKRGCDILIGTPGRIGDFVRNEMRWISLRRVKCTVLDEADLMLRDDWASELGLILAGGATQTDGDHQFLMFSATFPIHMQELASDHLSEDHIKIKVGRTGSSHDNIEQRVVWVNHESKMPALRDLIRDWKDIRTLVFVGKCSDVDTIDDYIYRCGLPCTSIHSGRTQYQREDAIRAFRSGKVPILIASHLMGRGVEFRNLLHVVNYDLPSQSQGGIDTYVHRIGRTARIGHRGLATSFYNETNEEIGLDLAKLMEENNQAVPDFLKDLMSNETSDSWDNKENVWATPNEGTWKDLKEAPSNSAHGAGSPINAGGVEKSNHLSTTSNGWGAENHPPVNNSWGVEQNNNFSTAVNARSDENRPPVDNSWGVKSANDSSTTRLPDNESW